MDPYVIVGNGVAATNAAEAIRSHGDRTPIVILTDQECAFYSRPCLYYIMLGRIEWEDAWGRPPRFYADNDIDLRCGLQVSRLHPGDHTIEVDGQGELRYSRLLLATGTRGRALPWAAQGLRGIVGLNTLMDVVAITDLLGRARQAVVVGGGLTSIELVEVCRHWGADTTFVMRGERFLDSQLEQEEAELVHQRLRANGVDLIMNEELQSLHGGNGQVSVAVCKSGRELECDLVGCAIGVIPNKEPVEAAGGETAAGIVVDDHMRTTLPDVFAAGDCAQVRLPDGSAAPAEMLWYVAADMGRVAGANMAGGNEQYCPRVFLNVSEFCGLDFCGVGDIIAGQTGVDEVRIRDRQGKGSARLVMRDGALVGACFLGDVRLSDIARGAIERKARLQDLSSGHPLRALVARGSP